MENQGLQIRKFMKVQNQRIKKPLFTPARREKGEVLYLESRTHRYELCYNGEKMVKNERETNNGENNEGSLMDVFRWSQCKKPLPQTVMRAIGIPLPPEHLQSNEIALYVDCIAAFGRFSQPTYFQGLWFTEDYKGSGFRFGPFGPVRSTGSS